MTLAQIIKKVKLIDSGDQVPGLGMLQDLWRWAGMAYTSPGQFRRKMTFRRRSGKNTSR
jgi:hypothetical protein